MHIKLSEDERQELEALQDIFSDGYIDNERVICFDTICEILKRDESIDMISSKDKDLLYRQLMNATDVLAHFYCKSEVMEKLIKYFE